MWSRPRQALRRGHVGGRRAARRRRRLRRAAASPRSWGRRARASRRCCTSSPGSTGRPSGWVEIDGTRLDALNDRDLTLLRRRSVGFVFQSLQPAPGPHRRGEHHPAVAHRRRAPRSRVARDADRHGRARRSPRAPPGRAVRRPAAARRRGAGADHAARRRLRRRADRQPRLEPPAARSSQLLRRAVDDLGQTIVMVTHDAVGGDGRRSRRLPGRRAASPASRSTPPSTRSSTTCGHPSHDRRRPAQPGPAQAAFGADRRGHPARGGDDRRHLRPDRPDPDGDERHHADRQLRRRRPDRPRGRPSPAPSGPTT